LAAHATSLALTWAATRTPTSTLIRTPKRWSCGTLLTGMKRSQRHS